MALSRKIPVKPMTIQSLEAGDPSANGLLDAWAQLPVDPVGPIFRVSRASWKPGDPPRAYDDGNFGASGLHT